MRFESGTERAITKDGRAYSCIKSHEARPRESQVRTHIGSKQAIAYLIACTLAMPAYAEAGSIVITPTTPSAGARSIVITPTTPSANAQNFTQEQLDQMLAPIALYPDALLSQMLMASTYPLEVVEAARWARQHPKLSATARRKALTAQPWDASVKSLCAFPVVLDRMSRDLVWTRSLGDAFIAQQTQMMDSIQSLRRKAESARALVSNKQQVVGRVDDDITITPQNPQVVYVPTYNPAVVYGNWSWPDDPPYYPAYWDPPTGSVLADDFYWGAGIAVGLGLWGLFDWRHHRVDIDLHRYNRLYGRHLSDAHWRFDPAHRDGVGFRGREQERVFGGHDRAAEHAREQFRGRESAFGGRESAFGHDRAFSDRGSGFRGGEIGMAPGERSREGAARGESGIERGRPLEGVGPRAGGTEFGGGGFEHPGGGEMGHGGEIERGGGGFERGGGFAGFEHGGGGFEHGGGGFEGGGGRFEGGGGGFEHGGGGMVGGGGGHGGGGGMAGGGGGHGGGGGGGHR